GCPEGVTRALEPEHRVKDVHRDEWLTVGRVRRAHVCERGGCARLVDADMEEHTLRALLVCKKKITVYRGVVLTIRIVNLRRREVRVHSEGACLVRDDRNEALAHALVAHEITKKAHESHRGCGLL